MASLVLAIAGSRLMAADEIANHRPVVEVFMPHMIDRHLNRALGRARGIVQDAYADIGVQVIWRFGNTSSSGCYKKPGLRQIVSDLRNGAPNGRSADVLAFANPYLHEGPCVTLLMDRLKNEAERNPETTGILLGHVLAHEIGHVLQGIERHSKTGLMKERRHLPFQAEPTQIVTNGGKPPSSSPISFAYSSLAVYDAVNAITGQYRPF